MIASEGRQFSLLRDKITHGKKMYTIQTHLRRTSMCKIQRHFQEEQEQEQSRQRQMPQMVQGSLALHEAREIALAVG